MKSGHNQNVESGCANESADYGQASVIELPDHRFVAIHSLEPTDDDSFVDQLLESNEAFRDLVARSKASPRRSFGAEK